MFKRNLSLTAQVKSHLKQRILNAEFEDGRIPSEADLASELNVGRSTIREALGRLENESVIYRRQGSGTFVNETGLQIKTPLEEIWDYEKILEAHGYTPSTKILSVNEESVNSAIATDLNLDPEAPALVVQKLFLADDNPVVLTRNYIPSAIITQPYTNDDFHLPMYEFLTRFGQQELLYYFSEIVPLAAPAWLVDKLSLSSQNKILLSFEELGYNQDNEPIIKAYSYFRDDLLRLRLIRRPVK